MTSRSGGVMLSPVTPESSGGLAFFHLSQMSRFQMPRIAEWVERTCKPQTRALVISGCYLCSATKCVCMSAPCFQGVRLGRGAG